MKNALFVLTASTLFFAASPTFACVTTQSVGEVALSDILREATARPEIAIPINQLTAEVASIRDDLNSARYAIVLVSYTGDGGNLEMGAVAVRRLRDGKIEYTALPNPDNIVLTTGVTVATADGSRLRTRGDPFVTLGGMDKVRI